MADRSSSLVSGLHAVIGEGEVGGYHWGRGGGVTFSAWISVQFARGSAFYDLTVAKDRGPYESN